MTTSKRYTFVSHMNREGICHDTIDKVFIKQLHGLENGIWVYSTTVMKLILVILKSRVYTANCPDQGKLSQILCHACVITKH